MSLQPFIILILRSSFYLNYHITVLFFRGNHLTFIYKENEIKYRTCNYRKLFFFFFTKIIIKNLINEYVEKISEDPICSLTTFSHPTYS